MEAKLTALDGQRDMSWGKRDRTWIFFLLFCSSSSVLVRWFRLHSCASGVTPFWGYIQNETAVFVYIYIVFSWCSVLVTAPSQLTFKPEVPLLPPGVGGRNISVSDGSTSTRKIWELQFFKVIFDYRSHSLVTGWPRLSALAWLLTGQLAVP